MANGSSLDRFDAAGQGGGTMPDKARPPEECTDMSEVREGVDATDRALIALLARRYGYMRAAARIKTDRDAVRDERRKREVIEAARRQAELSGLPAQDISDLWNDLVESSIAYELKEWDRLRQ